MRILLIITCIVTFIQCADNEHMNFERATRQMFFNGNIDTLNDDLINFYKSSKYLSLLPPSEGYTLYPPLSALGPNGRSERLKFSFKAHPFVSFKFREGRLSISSRKVGDGNAYSKPALVFIFDTKEQSEIAWEELVDRYNRISSRKKFENYKNIKLAGFTDDNSESIKEVGFIQRKNDIPEEEHMIVFEPSSSLDFEEE